MGGKKEAEGSNKKQKIAFAAFIVILVAAIISIDGGKLTQKLAINLLLLLTQPILLFYYLLFGGRAIYKILYITLILSLVVYPALALYGINSFFEMSYEKAIYEAQTDKNLDIDPYSRINLGIIPIISAIALLAIALVYKAGNDLFPNKTNPTNIEPLLTNVIRISSAILAITISFIILYSFMKEPSIAEFGIMRTEEISRELMATTTAQPPITYSQKKRLAHCNSFSYNGKEWYRCFAGFFDSLSQCEETIEYIDEHNIDIGEDMFTTDFCHSVMAIKDNNYKICRSNGWFSSGVCLSHLAAYNNNASVCDNAQKLLAGEEGIEEMEGCLSLAAYYIGDYEICNRIRKDVKDSWGIEWFKECIVGAAAKNRDEGKCGEFEDDRVRGYCLSEVAKMKKQ